MHACTRGSSRRGFLIHGGAHAQNRATRGTSDCLSLSDFKRNTSELLDRLRKTGNPLVLTINGKAEVVVQDSTACAASMAFRVERGVITEGW
jgi:prevent-host-death family protein